MLALLVACLLSGLVAMHHVSAAGTHGTAASMDVPDPVHAAIPGVAALPQLGDPQGGSPTDDRDDGVDSSLLHLCLAIMTGVVLIIASSPGWRRIAYRSVWSAVRLLRPAPAPRAPPPSAPARLALLCVMRT